MHSEAKVLDLIGSIYDAAADMQRWPDFLEHFADAVRATTAAITSLHAQPPQATITVAVRGNLAYGRRWEEYYASVSPLRREWMARFRQASAEGIVTNEDLLETSVLRRTEFYNDYLLPQKMVHHFGGPFLKQGQSLSVFNCFRPKHRKPFGSEEVQLLRLLFPHLQRAMQFHRLMAQLEGRYRATLEATDRISTGIVLLEDNGRILNLNRAATSTLDQNDGLRAGREGLAASRREQQQQLQAMITLAALTANRKGTYAGGQIGIDRPSGKRPFTVLVTPVAPGAFPRDAGRPAVIVFITDPDQTVQATPEVLASVFKLTAAESRLAELLMNGEGLVRAAERLGISHNTVRTQLKRIYEKTNTRHQGQLVRLLLSGVGPSLTGEVNYGLATRTFGKP